VSTPDTSAARPSVQDVALLIRARTKDSNGLEVGTFDGDTRPTADQVERLIDKSVALVGMQLPPLASVPADLLGPVAIVVALDAACRVEKSYWPEQVQTERSPYALLKVEYDEALAALTAALESGGTAGFGTDEIGEVPVGSWTSIPGSLIGR
jgi:hypothetical protein